MRSGSISPGRSTSSAASGTRAPPRRRRCWPRSRPACRRHDLIADVRAPTSSSATPTPARDRTQHARLAARVRRPRARAARGRGRPRTDLRQAEAEYHGSSAGVRAREADRAEGERDRVPPRRMPAAIARGRPVTAQSTPRRSGRIRPPSRAAPTSALPRGPHCFQRANRCGESDALPADRAHRELRLCEQRTRDFFVGQNSPGT